MTPLFSIIIPVYNVAPYLRECIDSVLAQKFTEWEAICIDDGSTDGSGKILDEYAVKDKRVRVIHQNNSGVGVARNVALDAANGEWICFLDADDVWSGELLDMVSGMIAKYPDERMFRFGYRRFQDSSCSFGKTCTLPACEVIDISKEVSYNDFSFFPFFCYVYHKGLFGGLRFPRYKRGEDRCVLNRIQLERVDQIVSTNEVLCSYRKRDGSTMNSVPSIQVIRDEMDHRLDIMQMIDANSKNVPYAGDWWLEGYFTRIIPQIVLDRPAMADQIKMEWRNRLTALLQSRGLSCLGRAKLRLCASWLFRPLGDFLVFTIAQIRRTFRPMKMWLCRMPKGTTADSTAAM